MFRWTGDKNHPYGELVHPSEVELDYANPKERKISTVIECYVTGHYMAGKGKIFSIKERYPITITYSNSTIMEAMARVKSQITMKFQAENPTFMIDDIFVPDLPPQLHAYEPLYVYRGGKMFRYQTRVEQGKFVMRIAKEQYKSRAQYIINKFGLRRQEGLIRRL